MGKTSISLIGEESVFRVTRTLRDCKQRSLTVSKKTPTVSKQASPFHGRQGTLQGVWGNRFRIEFEPISDQFRTDFEMIPKFGFEPVWNPAKFSREAGGSAQVLRVHPLSATHGARPGEMQGVEGC